MTDGINDFLVSVQEKNFKNTQDFIKRKSFKDITKLVVKVERDLEDFLQSSPALTEKQWDIVNKLQKNFDKFYKEKTDNLID